jgi:glycosyltransferase involved in cell wall biosynthesis
VSIEVSVVVPTRGRPDKLGVCLRGLGAQTVSGDEFEVLVSVDGEPGGEDAAAARWLPRAQVVSGPQRGPGAARNRAVARARGGIVLMLNDDVRPAPDLVERHAEAHRSRRGERPAMVLGAAPWVVPKPDRLLDRLVRDTSMVFFYDRMRDEPERDWGFRHAWTLNLSVPAAVYREVSGFDEGLPSACYEDLEWGWRVQQRFAAPVLYRPRALVEHDHRYEPAAYLDRERRLGAEAYRLARVSPACARAIFGRDVASPDEVAYSRQFVDRERPAAERLEQSFRGLADMPAAAIDGPLAGRLTNLLYEQHLLLKRWHWRLGLLVAAGYA